MTAKRVTITNVTDVPTPSLRHRRLANVPIRVGDESIAPGASARVRERDLAHPHITRLFRASALAYGERAASVSRDAALATPAAASAAPKDAPSADLAAPESSEVKPEQTRSERRAEARLRQQLAAEPQREDETASAPGSGPGDG